jgi:hypothetical protein
MAVCWIVVVIVAAFFVEHPDVVVGLEAAIVGPLIAVLLGAAFSREEKAGSWKTVIAHSGPREDELFRLGLKRGLTLGPISVLCIALVFVSIWTADHILTALGK